MDRKLYPVNPGPREKPDSRPAPTVAKHAKHA